MARGGGSLNIGKSVRLDKMTEAINKKNEGRRPPDGRPAFIRMTIGSLSSRPTAVHGAYRDRTDDLLLAKQALSQLS